MSSSANRAKSDNWVLVEKPASDSKNRSVNPSVSRAEEYRLLTVVQTTGTSYDDLFALYSIVLKQNTLLQKTLTDVQLKLQVQQAILTDTQSKLSAQEKINSDLKRELNELKRTQDPNQRPNISSPFWSLPNTRSSHTVPAPTSAPARSLSPRLAADDATR